MCAGSTIGGDSRLYINVVEFSQLHEKRSDEAICFFYELRKNSSQAHPPLTYQHPSPTVCCARKMPSAHVPCVLPVGYLRAWVDFAEWACEQQHGPAARYSVMLALTLRTSLLASRRHIACAPPRVWDVSLSGTSPDITCQRVSLFDDALTEQLLDTIDATSGYPLKLYPGTPCGSGQTDVWAHGLASRKLFRGRTNFRSMSSRFHLAAGAKWTPNAIHLASVCLFRVHFKLAALDECQLLMRQLGVGAPGKAFYKLRWFTSLDDAAVGTVSVEDGGTKVVDSPLIQKQDQQKYNQEKPSI